MRSRGKSKLKGGGPVGGENRRFDDLVMKGRNWRRDPGVSTSRGTLPAMMSQQSSLVLCLATSSRVKTLDDDMVLFQLCFGAGRVEMDPRTN